MHRAATFVAVGTLAAGLLGAAPAQAAGGQAHGTFSYFQATPKTVAQGAVTNPLTNKCYPIPEDTAVLVFNDTDTDAQAYGSDDCSGGAEALPHGGGSLGPYGSVRFGSS
jgi:hypothetical protein